MPSPITPTTAGKVPAALVAILDIAKGAVPALVGRYVFDSDGAAAAGAACFGSVSPGTVTPRKMLHRPSNPVPVTFR